MNSSRLLGLVSVAAVIFSMIAAPEVFAQAQTSGRIQGRVFADGTREPVVGAVVRAVLSSRCARRTVRRAGRDRHR